MLSQVNWSGESNWWCPPPALIPRVLRHAEWCRAYGSLVGPCWESAPYWPLLCPRGEGYATFCGRLPAIAYGGRAVADRGQCCLMERHQIQQCLHCVRTSEVIRGVTTRSGAPRYSITVNATLSGSLGLCVRPAKIRLD